MTPAAPPQGDAAALRGHAERAGIGMLSLAPDGTILWANRALSDLLGIEAGECAGRCFADFQPDEAPARDFLKALTRGEAGQAFPMRLLHKSGSFRHVLVFADVQLHDGRPPEAQCFVADVTGIQRDESTQQTLAAIVSSSDDAIVSKSLDGVIRSWNEGAERIFGYAAEEVVGRPITMIIPPAP
jgi:PAS domain S-box-containing protein